MSAEVKLYTHQEEALRRFWTLPSGPSSLALFDEQGLGKTLTILEHIKRLSERKAVFPILILCPKNVMKVWSYEVKKHFDCEPILLTKSMRERTKTWKLLHDKEKFFVCNYEGFANLDVDRCPPKTMILDESHRAKSIKAKLTESLLKRRHLIQNRFILSGTPIGRTPEDIWPQAEWVFPNCLGSIWGFRSKFITTRNITLKNGRTVKIPTGCKNIRELNKILSMFSVRRTKDECLDLPEKIYQVRYATMEGDQLKAYQQLKSNLKSKLDGQEVDMANALVQLSKLRQVIQGFVYADEGKVIKFEKNAKLKALSEELEALMRDNDKIIIMAEFIHDVEQIKQELSKFNDDTIPWKTFVYDGDVEQRKKAEKDFNESERAFLVSTIGKIKEGVTLTTSSVIIYFSNTYNYISRAQSEDRIHRIGQTNKCLYIDIVAENTIDEYVIENLKGKKNMAGGIVDGHTSSGNIEQEILQHLKGE